MAMAQLKYILRWYCKHTSLHGFKYLTNKNSSVLTKLIFITMSFCGLIFCGYLIVLQIQPDNYRIMSTVSTTSYPATKIRFPSVTVCNFNVVSNNQTGKFFKIVKEHNVKEESFNDFLQNLSALIIRDDLSDTSDYQRIYNVLNENGYTTDRLMAELAQPCKEMLKQCFWESQEFPCSEIFQFVKTTQGYCCSFNYYGTRNELKNIESPKQLYPKGPGPTFSLRIILDVAKDQYVSSIKAAYGFNVLVQDRLHYPEMEVSATNLFASEEMTVSVTPKLFDSSEDIKDYDINERCCFFENEGNLKWTSKYSHKTCLSECKAKAILTLCGCIPFYYPMTNRTRICTLFDIKCLQDNIYNYNALNIESCYTNTAVERYTKKQTSLNLTTCACYPQCQEVMYDLHRDKSRNINIIEMNRKASNFSTLNVYFDTYGCIKTDKNVFSRWYRILAVIGGIFGLCSGASVISIFETIYFVLFKIIVGKPLPTNSRFYVNDFSHHQYMMGKSKNIKKKTDIKFLKNNYVE